MDAAKARAVLVEMLGLNGEFSATNVTAVYEGAPLGVNVSAGCPLADLDGAFTADQLEAIAAWMRDPKGVAG